MKNKKNYNNTDCFFILCIVGLLVSLAWFAFLLYRGIGSAKEICQQIVSLGEISYDEDFLAEMGKLSGIRSVSPVRRILVQLRAEDYTMDTELVAVNLEELLMTGKTDGNLTSASNPVLLVGEKSLAGMTDSNGHEISEKTQKEYLTNFAEISWQYRLISQENSESEENSVSGLALNSDEDSVYLLASNSDEDSVYLLASNSDEDSVYSSASDYGGDSVYSFALVSNGDSDTATADDETWLPCRVGAVLSNPSEDIYISSKQGLSLSGLSAQSDAVTEILLTVQGRNNMENALAALKSGT